VEPHVFETVERVAAILGAQPAIVLVGYLLVRELRQWRHVLETIGGGLSGVSSALHHVARCISERPGTSGDSAWPVPR
jgi:hypothetical protein